MQVAVDAEGEVLAWLWLLVIFPVLIVSLGSAVHVAQHDAHALFAAQLLFVGALNAEFANVVTAFVVRVLFNVVLVHLAHVAQQVCSDGRGVLPRGALLDAETVEAEQFFAEQ